VKTELVNKFTEFNPNQFSTDGVGWERPFDPDDPGNHAKNRRVEIKVVSLENPE
jgi:flagellar motor protein MotB